MMSPKSNAATLGAAVASANTATAEYGFISDPRRTAAVSKAVRRALTRSLEQVLTALDDAGVSFVGDFARWRLGLEGNARPAPQLWALYHDVVQATLNQRADEAAALATELLSRNTAEVAPIAAVTTFSIAELGDDAGRCLAVVDNDPTNPLGLRAAPDVELERIRALVTPTRSMLSRGAPDLLAEMDALGHQILLGVGDRTVFGGAASVFLWGAVVLNPTLVKDRVDLAEALAHETAHALLFGLTLGDDLTNNDPAERFSSPLRRDPRPIEGIVHATYVLARMVYALHLLLDEGDLTLAERVRAAGKIERNIALYRAGLQTVDVNAHFTPEGAEIFSACRRAMTAQAAR